jgi:hypothetical protein
MNRDLEVARQTVRPRAECPHCHPENFGAAPAAPPGDGWYRREAAKRYGADGEIEFDDLAVVSESDEGAYVAAWVWVSKPMPREESDQETEALSYTPNVEPNPW